MTDRAKSGETKTVIIRVLAAVVIVFGVSFAAIAFATVEVCNDYVIETGSVVDECRHLQLTDPPVAAVGLVVLAALGAFFTEISGLGFTLKRQLRETDQTARNAHSTALTASDTALSAKNAAEVAEHVSLDAASATNDSTRPGGAGLTTSETIDDLAVEYNATRDLPSGQERTNQMTRIVSRMLSILSGVSPDNFDISGHLTSGDRGLRLAAYAYLYANPDPRRTQELVAKTIDEDKPFGQYWAIRAIARQLQEQPDALDLNSRRDLVALLARLASGTDRARELRALLDVTTRSNST